jgi:hypothetical protein
LNNDENAQMEDYTENSESQALDKKPLEDLQQEPSINIYSLLKENANLEDIANQILFGTFSDYDILRKDIIDKFLDFVILKVRTGKAYIVSAAYPTKRMEDEELERKIVELINAHLYPDIVFKILKYLARNVHDADSNLYLAFLITSDEIIKSIYDTFILFKKDIFEADRNKRTLNVKRIQQFPPATDHRFSSPLDAAARFKYVLEFIAIKQNVEHIYKKSDLSLTGIDA